MRFLPLISLRLLPLSAFAMGDLCDDGPTTRIPELSEANVSVPFDKIARVDLVRAEGADVKPLITFPDGALQGLRVESTLSALGQTAHGNLAVELRPLGDAVFKGPTP